MPSEPTAEEQPAVVVERETPEDEAFMLALQTGSFEGIDKLTPFSQVRVTARVCAEYILRGINSSGDEAYKARAKNAISSTLNHMMNPDDDGGRTVIEPQFGRQVFAPRIFTAKVGIDVGHRSS